VRVPGLVLMATAAACLVGCGGGSGTDTASVPCPKKPVGDSSGKSRPLVDVTLNGKDGPENASILMAAKCGYFADAGIKVTVTSPGGMNYPLFYVASGTVQIAVSNEPQVAMAAAKGAPVTAVGSLVSEPTAALIWLKKSGIDGIADLKGKTIAVPGVPFQKVFLETVLAREGLTLADLDVEVVGYELLPTLVEGKADAIFGGSANLEGAALEARGLDPVITPVQDLGVPGYDELVVIARPDFAAENPKLIRDFMTALSRGRAAAVANPGRVRKILEGSSEAAYDLSRAERLAQIEATFPLLSESARMDPEQAEGLAGWMYREGLVDQRPQASAMLTNRYLEEGDEG
jgi:putative hydroxymethylpyrimidine transport system substrate-binding protein